MPALLWTYIALTLLNGKRPFPKGAGHLRYRLALSRGVTFDRTWPHLPFLTIGLPYPSSSLNIFLPSGFRSNCALRPLIEICILSVCCELALHLQMTSLDVELLFVRCLYYLYHLPLAELHAFDLLWIVPYCHCAPLSRLSARDPESRSSWVLLRGN